MRLILASSSPRRKELLSLLVTDFGTERPETDESQKPNELPERYVQRLATEKARACEKDGWAVLGADTVVTIGSQIFGKPACPEEASDTLHLLSGRTHQVMTGVALLCGGRVHSTLTTTRVTFDHLSEDAIARYLLTDEPYDKAGAYGIQGYAGAFVRRIEGSYSAVVGLPLCETRELLLSAGVPVRHG